MRVEVSLLSSGLARTFPHQTPNGAWRMRPIGCCAKDPSSREETSRQYSSKHDSPVSSTVSLRSTGKALLEAMPGGDVRRPVDPEWRLLGSVHHMKDSVTGNRVLIHPRDSSTDLAQSTSARIALRRSHHRPAESNLRPTPTIGCHSLTVASGRA